MSSAALIAGITVAIHYGLPMIEAIAPPLLQLPQARVEQTFIRELDLYRNTAPKYRAPAQAQLILLAPPQVVDLLPPLWQCSTRFECSLAIALIKSRIHEGH